MEHLARIYGKKNSQTPYRFICHFSKKYNGFQFGILTMVVLLVIYVPNIKEVFGLAGASVATMLVIIMPAGFYYLVSSMTHA